MTITSRPHPLAEERLEARVEQAIKIAPWGHQTCLRRSHKQRRMIPPSLGGKGARGLGRKRVMPERDEMGPVIRKQHVDPIKLQRAKELRRAMTPAEKLLWNALRTNHLHGAHFRHQQIIAGFIVDFYCHAARLAVEVDGEAHRGQEEYDAERDQVLAGQGIQVLRVTNEDVERRLPDVLRRIGAYLSPNPSPPRGARNMTHSAMCLLPPSLPGKGSGG